jgi:hypothetical protein
MQPAAEIGGASSGGGGGRCLLPMRSSECLTGAREDGAPSSRAVDVAPEDKLKPS